MTSQKMLTWICVYPADETVSKFKRATYAFAYAFILISNLCVLASSVAFFLKYVSVDLEQSLYAVFQITAYGSMTYLIIVSFLLRSKIPLVFDDLAKIYEASMFNL